METFDLKEWRPDCPFLIDHIAIDSRTISAPQTLFVALKGAVDGHKFLQDAAQRGAIAALVDKNYEGEAFLPLIRVENTLHALQEIAALYRKKLKAKVIALIGSEGKTLTKDCLGPILSKKFNTFCSPESFNSQLGVALSLLSCKSHHEIALIEAAVSHPGEMARLEKMIAPDSVIITNITSKHERTLLGSHAEEMSIMAKNLKKEALFLVPQNFSSGGTCWESGLIRSENGHYKMNETSFHLAHPFPHAEKILELSFKAATLLGVDEKTALQGLHEFDPAPQQTEVWSSSWGTTFINAPYCQSSLAVAKALKKLKLLSHRGKRFILFFGMDVAAGDYQRIAEEIKTSSIDKVYFIEKKVPFTPTCEHAFFATKGEACRALYETLGRDDTVLLIGSQKNHLDTLVLELMDMIGDSRLSINLSAIEHNITEIRAHMGNSRIMVMLKAFGYGTDNLLLAKFLSQFGIDIFGVAHVDEAILLKRKGVKGSFFIINAGPQEAEKAALWDCEVAVSSPDLIEALDKAGSKLQKKLKVHLHVDTGMGRFGCKIADALDLALKIAASPSLELEGLMTHFACADMPAEDTFTHKQITLFKHVLRSLHENGIYPPFIHAANSGATVRNLFPEGNMIRLGLALFGLKNCSTMPSLPGLRCALSLTTKITGINHLQKGDTVSYGRTYTEERLESRMAILPLGYFDGLHRHYSSKSSLLVSGQKVPMVGRICMDFMMVDITALPSCKIGDEVLVFGSDNRGHFLSPEELAEAGGTIAHELITCLGPRIQRIFLTEK